MKKKILDIAFAVLFMAVVTVPLLLINTKSHQVSDIDNKELKEWETIALDEDFTGGVEEYLNDRIGFREEAIDLYTVLNDKLFHVLVHPLYMYGENGNIYYKDPSYIEGYQHLNINEPFMDSMVEFLQKTGDYLREKDIGFVYFLAPDKKTVYPEYFPKTIHVLGDKGWTDYIEEKLAKTDIDHVIPVRELKEAKNTAQVYNVKYDATHWNELGAMVGHKLLDERMQKYVAGVKPLSEEDFDLTYDHKDSLDISRFRIDEDVPDFVPKNDTSEDASTLLSDELVLNTANFYHHYVNPDAENDQVAMLLVDSYFGNYGKFYSDRYREVYLLHRQNYQMIQYYVNLFRPDVVVFETAERSLLEEMQLLYWFDGYDYTPPYKEDAARTAGDEGVKLTFDSMTGAGVSGDTMEVYQDDHDILTINGSVEADNGSADYYVYAKVGDDYYETSYEYLKMQEGATPGRKFQFNIQKRFLGPGEIEFLAVDATNNKEYRNLVNLQVKGSQ